MSEREDAEGPRAGRARERAEGGGGRAEREGGRARRTARALLEWFVGRDRDVPWRNEGDPYRIWVAEVMAQQTRMETVRDRYSGFIDRFPDVESLAAAGLDDVLKSWEGLGYYARARNLHRAARRVVEEHGGSLPREVAGLRALPGVGPYTAGAIASLAYGLPEPAIDGNVRRVLSRVLDLAEPTPARLERAARRLLETAPAAAAKLNQALMDLGSLVCTPGTPDCAACPVAGECLALRRGTVAERPAARDRGPLPHRDIATGLVQRNGRILIQRRPTEGLLGGLWEFPGGKVEAEETPREAVHRELREELAIEVEVGERIATVDHAYSHFRITLHAFHARVVSGEPRPRAATALTWADPEALDRFAFPAANRRVLEALRAESRPGGLG